MDFLHIVMPIGDGVSLEDIPEDVKEAAKKSVEMWEDYLEERNRREDYLEERNRQRLEELRIQKEKLEMKLKNGLIYRSCHSPYMP